MRAVENELEGRMARVQRDWMIYQALKALNDVTVRCHALASTRVGGDNTFQPGCLGRSPRRLGHSSRSRAFSLRKSSMSSGVWRVGHWANAAQELHAYPSSLVHISAHFELSPALRNLKLNFVWKHEGRTDRKPSAAVQSRP